MITFNKLNGQQWLALFLHPILVEGNDPPNARRLGTVLEARSVRFQN